MSRNSNSNDKQKKVSLTVKSVGSFKHLQKHKLLRSNPTMETISGSDLLETFHSLGINTGNVSKLTIDALFDTDCEATKEMLHWIYKHVGEENVLTAHENEEYEQSLENKSLLSEKQCEAPLTQIQVDYPGIFEYEKNLLEVECMEDELEMLLEEEGHLEQLLSRNEDLSKKLSKEIKKTAEEEIMLMVKKEAAQQKCMEFSYKLDDAHEKLQQQIGRYAEHLNEFEHAARPTFISNIPTLKYDEYYSAITSYLGLLLRREYECLPKLEVTGRTARKKSEDSISSNDGVIDQLGQRIFKSIRSYFYALVKEARLRAELTFLQGVNVSEVMYSAPPENSAQFMLEANIFAKEELLERLVLDMENVARQICDGFIDTPKILLMEQAMNLNQKKLECLSQIDIKTKEILAKHILLYLLLEKEKDDIQSTDKFFRDVHCYITRNLQNCQIRTEAMMQVINENKIYRSLPMEQKFKIFSVIKALLRNGEENSTDVNAIDAIRSFSNECNQMEQRVFFGDYAEHRRFALEIEQEVEVMRRFLMSGPTSQVVTIPRQLIEDFNKIHELQRTQETLLKSAMQVLTEAQKKLSSNKWLQVKRQLWIWFLFEPRRVLSAIEQIEAAVKQKRNEPA